jgi:hypothetical protein
MIYSKVLIVWSVVWNLELYSDVESIRPGLLDLASRILGPNSVMQAALPNIFLNTPQNYFDGIMGQIQVMIKFTI